MDDRLKDMERAAAADPSDLQVQLAVIRAHLRRRRSEDADLNRDFVAFLQRPNLHAAELAYWIDERCDRRQMSELFFSALEHRADFVRDRAIWALGVCQPEHAFPLLLALADSGSALRRRFVDQLCALALGPMPFFRLYLAALRDRSLISAALAELLMEALIAGASGAVGSTAGHEQLCRRLAAEGGAEGFEALWQGRQRVPPMRLRAVIEALAAFPERIEIIRPWVLELLCQGGPVPTVTIKNLLRLQDRPLFDRIKAEPERFMAEDLIADEELFERQQGQGQGLSSDEWLYLSLHDEFEYSAWMTVF